MPRLLLGQDLPSRGFIDVGASVVDANYRGEVGVVLFKYGDQDFEVKMGDRIAQLILEKIDTLPMEKMQGLEETISGSRGFGSTGVNRQNDTSKKEQEEGEKERTEKKYSEVKNETLKGSDSVERGLTGIEERPKEHPDCPARDKSYPSSS